MESFERMYSVKEVSAALGWSVDTIRRLIEAGELKAVKLPKLGGKGKNRKFHVREREIKRFLDANQTE